MDKQEFEHQARQRLEEHAAGLDGKTASALHRARVTALQSQGHRRPLAGPLAWAGSAAVTASLVVALFLYNQKTIPLPDIYADPAQQAAAEELELMDDLEFIAWLVLEEELADETGNQS